jgi:putative ABC transport system ATP-binding protein
MKTKMEKSGNKNNKHLVKAEKIFQKASEKLDPELVLEVRNLTKIYPLGNFTVKALNNLSLQIKKGEFVAVVGPSGSGKTTLINCLGALDFPNEGKIIYNIDGKGMGMDITTMNDTEHKIMRLRRIGLIFQFYNLFPILTAYENVELPSLLAKKGSEESERKVKELLKMVGLELRMYHLPTQMSGGEQQRVTIARSLVNEPLILLADEPTGELDTETTTQIIKIFLDLKNAGQSILMVTHNTRIAEVTDRILTLRDGEIIEERKGGKSIREMWYE